MAAILFAQFYLSLEFLNLNFSYKSNLFKGRQQLIWKLPDKYAFNELHKNANVIVFLL